MYASLSLNELRICGNDIEMKKCICSSEKYNHYDKIRFIVYFDLHGYKQLTFAGEIGCIILSYLHYRILSLMCIII